MLSKSYDPPRAEPIIRATGARVGRPAERVADRRGVVGGPGAVRGAAARPGRVLVLLAAARADAVDARVGMARIRGPPAGVLGADLLRADQGAALHRRAARGERPGPGRQRRLRRTARGADPAVLRRPRPGRL